MRAERHSDFLYGDAPETASRIILDCDPSRYRMPARRPGSKNVKRQSAALVANWSWTQGVMF
jgi:hypothetical protein